MKNIFKYCLPAVLCLTALLFTRELNAAKKPCFTCTAGTSYYDVPVHGRKGASSKDVQAESLRVCRIIIDSWNRNPAECATKGCVASACAGGGSGGGGGGGGNQERRCSSNVQCAASEVCLGGRCVYDNGVSRCWTNGDCPLGLQCNSSSGRCQ